MTRSIWLVGCLSFAMLFGVDSVSAQGSRAVNTAPDENDHVVSGWQMQDAAKVQKEGAEVSAQSFRPEGWYKATVPGTVLTTLVDNHVYPEPLYGENNRPEIIPDSLSRTPFWYRTEVEIPESFTGRHIWLDFEGINYSAVVWVEGHQVGTMRGAFQRGVFDVSPFVKPGKHAVVAVLISPQPHAGTPHEHTLRAGMGQNGGITAIDGPTFLSTIGWDWVPAIRDRDTGLWREVRLRATGPVLVENPYVTTDLKVPGLETAGVTVSATLRNISDQIQTGVLKGSIEQVSFEQQIELAPNSSKTISFSPTTSPVLLLNKPRVWWPNGYGAQNLYKLHLSFATAGKLSSEQDISFGVRKVTYTVSTTSNLAFVVNGVPVFIRGGDWGLDDALKRIPYERMDAQIRMHKLANLNMIRNWVGQSTSEQFYELCDKYGLLVWDEFFQPNPLDGPNPTDIETYLANVKDKVLRFRNHPSIVLWCARNEGDPPKEIDDRLKAMLAELDSARLYQANSSDGRGVRSHGPYRWRAPRDFYLIAEGLKTETGSVSVPTLESIQGMMPKKDWETITDDWAEHDFARGAASGDTYPGIIASRYGAFKNLADFVRKSQLANYEAFRAMYEGRNAEMFHPVTGILTWMSHPAQPSFVWQLYHYDLEPNSSLFAAMHASEMVHVQFNEISGKVQVINNASVPLAGGVALAKVFNLDGSLSGTQSFPVAVAASSVGDAGDVEFHEPSSEAQFISLELHDGGGKLLSQNFYWHNQPDSLDKFSSLDSMPKVTLETAVTRSDEAGRTTFTVSLKNSSANIALMSHLQLHRASDGARVLPAYYTDNYISLAGGDARSISIECETSKLQGGAGLVLVDGFNVLAAPSAGNGVSVKVNENAQVDHWPATGLPFQQSGLR